MGAGGIEPPVGYLTCFSTADLQSAVRNSSPGRVSGAASVWLLPCHLVSLSPFQCGGRESNPHCRGPHPRASCRLGYRRSLRPRWPGRESNPQRLDLESSASAVGLPGRGARTRSLPGRREGSGACSWPEWDSNPQQQRPERCASALGLPGRAARAARGLSDAAGRGRTDTVEVLGLAPPADWATAAWRATKKPRGPGSAEASRQYRDSIFAQSRRFLLAIG